MSVAGLPAAIGMRERKMKPRTWALAGAIAGLAIAGGITATRAVPRAAPHQFTVTMANMTYGKLPAGVKVGDIIIWVNRDTVPHSATARDRSFDVRLGQGQTTRTTMTKPGTFAIYCIYHPAMRGTLVVAP